MTKNILAKIKKSINNRLFNNPYLATNNQIYDNHDFVLLSEEISSLGKYGPQLQTLNERRREIVSSLGFLENDSALDVEDIKKHLVFLYQDLISEAKKLSGVSAQLYKMTQGLPKGMDPDTMLRQQIKELDTKISKTKDPAIKDNLTETANSKTKTLLELGKIAVYKARVETKMTRLDAFLSELQLGAMRASLEENRDYQNEITHSMKMIRSSFTAVDEFRQEVKLLTESQDKQDEEIPYYIRYKQVWSEEVADEHQDPPQPAPKRSQTGSRDKKAQNPTDTEYTHKSYKNQTIQVCPHCEETLVVDGTLPITTPCPHCHILIKNSSVVERYYAKCPACRKPWIQDREPLIRKGHIEHRIMCARCGIYICEHDLLWS